MTMPIVNTPQPRRGKSTPLNGHVEPQGGSARRVPVADIRIDSAYQRDVDSARVNRLVRDFDPQLAGALILSARAGSLWCVDGQHRLQAMKEMGTPQANAVVFTGLTQREEADLFVKYNRNRKGLTAWDLFKAELVAGHEEALAVVTIVAHAGYRIDRQAGPTNIGAVSAIRRIFRLGGEPLLILTLGAIKRNWSADRNALAGQVIEGLAIFYHSFRSEPQYEDKRTDAILDGYSPSVFQRRAQEIAAERTTNGISAANLAEAIRDKYNERLSPPKRLGSLRKIKKAGWTPAR